MGRQRARRAGVTARGPGLARPAVAVAMVAAAEEVERLGRIARNLPLFPIAQKLCHGLLEHKDGLVLGDEAYWWLDGIAEVVDDRRTDLEKAKLVDLLVKFVREIHKEGRERNRPTTTTGEARQALGGHRVRPPRAADDPAPDTTFPNWDHSTTDTSAYQRRPPCRIRSGCISSPQSGHFVTTPPMVVAARYAPHLLTADPDAGMRGVTR